MRKFDFYGQCIIVGLAICTAIASLMESGYLFIAIFLLIPLGIWQLISAAAISLTAGQPGNKSILKYYWIAAGICLAVFISTFFFMGSLSDNTSLTIAGIAMCGGFFTGLYYMYIYKKYFLGIEEYINENTPLEEETANYPEDNMRNTW